VVKLLLRNKARKNEVVERKGELMVVPESECSGILRLLIQGSAESKNQLVPTDISPSYIQGNEFHYPITVQLKKDQQQSSLDKSCPSAVVVVHQGHDKVIEAITRNGAVAPPPSPSPESFEFTLSSSVGRIERKALKLKLTSGESSALIIASCNGHYEVVRKLLDDGAQVNLKTSDRFFSTDVRQSEWSQQNSGVSVAASC